MLYIVDRKDEGNTSFRSIGLSIFDNLGVLASLHVPRQILILLFLFSLVFFCLFVLVPPSLQQQKESKKKMRQHDTG